MSRVTQGKRSKMVAVSDGKGKLIELATVRELAQTKGNMRVLYNVCKETSADVSDLKRDVAYLKANMVTKADLKATMPTKADLKANTKAMERIEKLLRGLKI